MKMIIIDIYEFSEEYMKEHDLYCKYRVKSYCYDTNMIEDWGADEEYVKNINIGQIIETKRGDTQ